LSKAAAAVADTMGEDSDVNEFDDELEMGVVVAKDKDGYAPVGGNAVAGTVTGSVDGAVLRSGISLNVVILPMFMCIMFIYMTRVSLWHFHFAEKMVFLVLSLMGLLGSMFFSFHRVLLLAFDQPEASGVICLR
jgi:hypothetical protein